MTEYIQHLNTLVEPAVPSEYMSDYEYLKTKVRDDLLSPNAAFDTIKSRYCGYYSSLNKARIQLILSGSILATEVLHEYKIYNEDAVDKAVEIAKEEIRSFLFTLPRIIMEAEAWEVN
jgi:hypothetical protein